MNPDARDDGRTAGRPVRTDGGAPMPGVPSEDESPEEPSEPDAREAGNANTSSGSQMPGVPESKGEKPAVDSGGESCEAPTEEEEAEEPDAHDLTTAFTLAALTQLENPAAVVSEARSWSDWVGVVGEADAPTINTFLRRNGVDVDFFNGAASPAQRLSRVTAEGSTFHSDRLVLVGAEGQEQIAEEAGWEFEGIVPTAEKAGWALH
ncbi:MAG: hypothetical protein U5K70_01395 [Halodesulfurarchaeum sp.]|nr:hypothetical protein [Halodesulfurarchaeum sp.]